MTTLAGYNVFPEKKTQEKRTGSNYGGMYWLYWFTVLEVSGAEGLVRETISWMARRSLSLWRGLLIPISLWISVSDRADMMAPLFTLARQAATYQAGIPTHSCSEPSGQQTSAPQYHKCAHYWQPDMKTAI